MRPASLAKKPSLYFNELRYALLQTPGTLAERCSLVGHVLAFHWRNWRKIQGNPADTIKVPFSVGGKRHLAYLRPAAGDLAIFFEIFARDAYALDTKVLPPERVKTIIDAGAHVGLAALYFAHRYPHARIFSIEPNPDNFARLKSNVSAEPRITPIQACLTGAPNQQTYITTSGEAWSFRAGKPDTGVLVPGVSINQLREEHKIGHIDLLKIDIEGGEEDVFAHPCFLKHVGTVLAELHGIYDLARFNADLQPAGFIATRKMLADGSDIFFARRKSDR